MLSDYFTKVTPHVGVWIETFVPQQPPLTVWSLPTWECGLKQHAVPTASYACLVTPHVGVWIETR